MTKPKKRTAKRIVRSLTPDEAIRIAEARRDVETNRAAILREGSAAMAIWSAMRRDADQTIQKLKDERERLGLSLADVEQRSGLRRSVLSRLENDRTANPTLLTLQRYAASLGMTLQTALAKVGA